MEASPIDAPPPAAGALPLPRGGAPVLVERDGLHMLELNGKMYRVVDDRLGSGAFLGA